MGEQPDEPSEAGPLIEGGAEDLDKSVAELIAKSPPDLRGSSNGPEFPGEAEFLAPGLEKVVTYCSSQSREDVQVGPFFKAGTVAYLNKGDDWYLHGELRDGRTGYYRSNLTEDGIQLTEAFGGPTETPCSDFEDINGVFYLRVPAEGDKTALKDSKGNMYTGRAYDTIKRCAKDSTHLGGVVHHVTDGGKEGYILNGEICGRHNGLNLKSTFVRVGNDKLGYKIYLIAENEASKDDEKWTEKKVVDINIGEILFADTPKCDNIRLEVVGSEIMAVKSHGSSDVVHLENGSELYHGLLQVQFGTHFHCPGRGEVFRVYNEEGWINFLDRRGKPCFTKDFVPREADDGPNGDGLHEIDRILYMKLDLIKENPRDEEDKIEVTYRTADGKDGFKGPHDMEMPNREGQPDRVTVDGITAICFKNRKTNTIYHIGSNGMEMFGRDHFADLKTIEWKYDSEGHKKWKDGPEGKKVEDATILKHLVDDGKGHTVLDYQARAFFQNNDSETPDYHTNLRDFLVVSHKGRNVLVAEAEDPVRLGRTVGNALLKFASLRWGQFGITPSTYYLMDGTKFSGMKALKKHLGVPKDAQVVKIDNFKDATIKTRDTRDSQRLNAVTPSKEDPGYDNLLAQVKAAKGKEAPDSGEKGILDEPLETEPPAEAVSGSSEEPAPKGVIVPDEAIVLPGDAGDVSGKVVAEEASGEGNDGDNGQSLASMLLGDELHKLTIGPADDGSSQAASEEAPQSDESSQGGEDQTGSWLDEAVGEGGEGSADDGSSQSDEEKTGSQLDGAADGDEEPGAGQEG